ALAQVETAFVGSEQVRDALKTFLELVPDVDPAWIELATDAESLARRMKWAVEVLEFAFREDFAPVVASARRRSS
ncbi:MAG TPA: hypothetical protein VFW76_02410, partial [Ktedonobacterales bacterium]|nr:hypothetical protein [Ktedonobacterales bacterium]